MLIPTTSAGSRVTASSTATASSVCTASESGSAPPGSIFERDSPRRS